MVKWTAKTFTTYCSMLVCDTWQEVTRSMRPLLVLILPRCDCLASLSFLVTLTDTLYSSKEKWNIRVIVLEVTYVPSLFSCGIHRITHRIKAEPSQNVRLLPRKSTARRLKMRISVERWLLSKCQLFHFHFSVLLALFTIVVRFYKAWYD